jgi:hypothetical protein
MTDDFESDNFNRHNRLHDDHHFHNDQFIYSLNKANKADKSKQERHNETEIYTDQEDEDRPKLSIISNKQNDRIKNKIPEHLESLFDNCE